MKRINFDLLFCALLLLPVDLCGGWLLITALNGAPDHVLIFSIFFFIVCIFLTAFFVVLSLEFDKD